MIQVDISNIWGDLELRDLLGIEQEVFAAHAALGENMLQTLTEDMIDTVLKKAEAIRADSAICVVMGSGADFLGARAVVELLQDMDRSRDGLGLLFVGGSANTRNWNALKAVLEGKDVSLIAFPEAGTEEDCAPVLLGLKWLLERKYGTDEAGRRIHMAAAGREAALLVMAAAGLDIAAFCRGLQEGAEAFNLRSFENPAWLYTAVRILMQRSGKAVELLSIWEPDCAALGKWWQHLFLKEDGLFPVPAEFPADLPVLDAKLEREPKSFFETLVRFAPEEQTGELNVDVSGMDSLDEEQENAWWNTLEAHADRGVSVITVDCGAPDARTLGWLTAFLKLGAALSRGLCMQEKNSGNS